ncbi:glycosyltransferase [Chryseobacterium polytrichastri]|uniref:Glycosyltransferase involved in cell wall bisynthesis n=1 Tax=Chryseobacterium polytrichastri TaxID=1302687 RepID=A0A1M6YK38_9FLAO|nr:glycosyltransferase [Chryseobacterium polytrichastri]SHL18379.1 Glycosyltransferase involved in cell wall bisynthesis [Chryseobacterium polytrichastri]
MKILFISSWFPNKLEPTNGNFVQRHAEAAALFHDVEILHAIGDINQKEEFIFDDNIINGIRTLVVYYKNTHNPILNFIKRIKAYKKGFQRMQKPELVHANVLHNNMLFAVYLKKKYKIPFIVTEHWTALRRNNYNITSSKIKRIAKYIGNQASVICPVSEDLKKGIENIGVKKPMVVIPNVVDTHLFSPRFTENSVFNFIHISSLIPRKNVGKILKVAIKLLKKGYNFTLQIGGDGDFSEIKNIVKKEDLQNNIDVFGMQTLKQVSQRMHDADCFILFSDDENQPCVIAESFASGIHVISTNVGGISEFFPENSGILLDNADENLLENAMIKILSDHHSFCNKDTLVQYAQKTFSQETIGKQFSEIYHKVI